MVVTTLFVVACPAVAVLALDASDLVTSPVFLSLIAIPLSILVSWLGAAIWKRRAASGDLVFGDLMLWGWLRRWRFERLLAHTALLVGADPDDAGLSRERRARLLERLSRALEARDPRTHGHSRRVARHAAGIAKRMSLRREEVARIRTAAVLHDVGKIDTPRKIIDKPGPLSDSEYEVVKRHASVGAGMVAALGDDLITAFVRSHHERLDGRGYPDGLAGDAIPLGARIIAVADTFDAVTSARPYRQAMTHRQALALLGAAAGTQLDPDVVRGFRRYYSGHRPVALWAAFLALPRQAGYLLFDIPRFGTALTSAKVAAASLATAAVTAAVVHPAVPVNSSSGEATQVSRPAAEGPGTASTTSAQAGDKDGNGGKDGPDGPDAVNVAAPGVATAPSSEVAASPGSSGGSEGAPATDPSGPSESAGGSSSPTTSVTKPVATAAPPVKPVTSAVNQTVEGVGGTVDQVVTPTVESVNGIVEQTTTGVLAGGK